MKTFIKTALQALTICLPALASAHDIDVDGIYYNINPNTNQATVTYQGTSPSATNGYSGEVVIPATFSSGGVTYTVSAIGQDAFEYCSNLTSVKIPYSVTIIDNRAFYYCENLASLSMGSSVTTIGSWALCGCRNLTSVHFPNSVTTIGESAFRNCSGLTSVTMGNSVNTIGKDAFNGCTSLNGVTITDVAAWCSINFANEKSNPLCQAQHLYMNGAEAQNVTIPSSCTAIGNYAFDGFTGLKSVTMPNGITTIGNNAFHGCSNLASVELPNTITSTATVLSRAAVP